jgi:hypothetical protein
MKILTFAFSIQEHYLFTDQIILNCYDRDNKNRNPQMVSYCPAYG